MYDPVNQIQLIIPVFHDRKALQTLLPRLLAQGWMPSRITVVDASDENPYPKKNDWDIQVLHPPAAIRGRALQMNYGVQHSQSKALLFLHADTVLPDTARNQIHDALQGGYVGGCFSRRFDSSSRFLRFTCLLADLRAKTLGWYFGDQAIFCSREAFEKAGGFPDISPFEDLEFSRRLKKQGPRCLLKPGILSSARRFEAEGPFRRTLKDLLLTISYLKQSRSLKD